MSKLPKRANSSFLGSRESRVRLTFLSLFCPDFAVDGLSDLALSDFFPPFPAILIALSKKIGTISVFIKQETYQWRGNNYEVKRQTVKLSKIRKLY